MTSPAAPLLEKPRYCLACNGVLVRRGKEKPSAFLRRITCNKACSGRYFRGWLGRSTPPLAGESVASQADAVSRGLRYYYTGRPCAHGHIAKRSVLNRGCVECINNINSSPRTLRRKRIYNVSEKGRAARRRYAPHANRDQSQLWAAANRKAVNTKARERYSKNPEHHHEKRHQRRAMKRNADGQFSAEDWRKVVERSPKCHWCKRPFNGQRRPTHDHVIALTKRGPNSPENSVCACRSCNSSKGDRNINPVSREIILI